MVKSMWCGAAVLAVSGAGLAAAVPACAASSLKMIYQANDFPSTTQLLPPVAVSYGQVISGSQSQGLDGVPQDDGTLFLLTPGPNGNWTKTTLHTFNPGLRPADGAAPDQDLLVDKSGNVWGTTSASGANGTGTLFELVKPAAKGGAWSFRTVLALPVFQTSNGGSNALAFDSKGNLYGVSTTGCRDPQGCGDFWQVTAKTLKGGPTPVRLLGTVPFSLGATPEGLAIDTAGNLFGTTYGGGSTAATQYGTVWELSPSGAGAYAFNIIHSFCSIRDAYNYCVDGENPHGGVTYSNGALYGTTVFDGGAYTITNPASGQPQLEGSNGLTYAMTPPAPGAAWGFTPLHALHDYVAWDTYGPDNLVHNPQGAPVVTTTGQLLVATASGGALHAQDNVIHGAIISVSATSGAETILNNHFAAEYKNLRSGPALDLNNARQLHRGAQNRVFGIGVRTFDATCTCEHYWQNLYQVTQ